MAEVGLPGPDGERGDTHYKHLKSTWMALGVRDTLINMIPTLAKLTIAGGSGR